MRFFIGAGLILLGLLVETIAVLGIYRFKFGLNRMHSAAIGDTLGMGLVCVGLCVLCGLSLTTCKLIVVIFCFWMAAPVSSHLLARLEITTNEKIDDYAPLMDKMENSENQQS